LKIVVVLVVSETVVHVVGLSSDFSEYNGWQLRFNFFIFSPKVV